MKRFLALLCVGLCLFPAARAGILPSVDQLLQAAQDQPFQCAVQAALPLPDGNDPLQQTASQWLAQLSAILGFGKQHDRQLLWGQLRSLQSQTPLFGFIYTQDAARQTLSLIPGAQQYVLRGQGSLLEVLGLDLSGGPDWVLMPHLNAVEAGFRSALHSVWLVLEPHGAASAARTRLQQAGTSASSIVYTLPAEDCNRLFPNLTATFFEQLGAALPMQRPALAAAESGTAQITFVSKVTLKRYLAADGADLGVAFSGTVLYQGVQRRVRFLAAYGPSSGLAIDFSAPSTDAKQISQYALNASWEQKQEVVALKINERLRYKTPASAAARQVRVRLQDTPQLPGRRLSGTIQLQQTAAQGPAKTTAKQDWDVDLLFEQNTLSGTLKSTLAASGAQPWRIGWQLSAQPAAAPTDSPGLETVDLAGTDAQAAATAQQTLRASLLRAWLQWLRPLPEGQRRLLLHALGRTTYTQGESVPVQPLGPPDTTPAYSDFVVDREDQP